MWILKGKEYIFFKKSLKLFCVFFSSEKNKKAECTTVTKAWGKKMCFGAERNGKVCYLLKFTFMLFLLFNKFFNVVLLKILNKKLFRFKWKR
jgi:hypothetical protein